MYKGENTRKQTLFFIKILIPVILYQMISYSSNMIGTFMLGHYNTKDLAGVSLGVNVWTPIFSVISTLVLALVPIVSNLIGEGREKEVSVKVKQFIYVGFFISLVVTILQYNFSYFFIENLDIEKEISFITVKFLKYQSLSLIPITLYVTLRSFIDSLGLTKISMTMMLIYVPINILLSYLFIFGKFGFHEFGGVGVAISSIITFIISLLLAIFVVSFHPRIKRYHIIKFSPIRLEHWPEIFKLGLPMAFAVLLETFMFSVLSLMVSRFDTITIAAHQSSLNFSGFLYCLPMSISTAITIIVSYHLGAKNYKIANKYVYIGISVCLVLSIFISIFILLFQDYIPYLYGNDRVFVSKVKKLILYIIGFTIFDSFSSCFVGALRAHKKVIPICISQIIGFYVLAIPFAFYLVYRLEIGVKGLWISWLLGLAIYAIMMTIYYFKILDRKIK